MSEEDYQKYLAKRLAALACDDRYAPYVAQRLIFARARISEIVALGRLEALGPSNLPDVAKTLLDAAEGRTTDCPGVKGLDAKSIAQLRKWAAKAESRTTQTAK